MAECKYPNEVCANMTVLNSVAYCDSTPCSLRDELPKQTNADRIRSMTDEELAEQLIHKENGKWICSDREIFFTKEVAIVHELHWLQSEVKV